MANISQMIISEAIVTITFGSARRIDSERSLSSLKRESSMKTCRDEKESSVRRQSAPTTRRSTEKVAAQKSSTFHG